MTDNRDAAVKIENLDLTAIKYKLMVEKGWSISKLERVELIYRRFLTLIALYPSRTFVPSDEVDEFWHAHILDTRKYASDTYYCLGYFLHHFPYFGLSGEHDIAMMTSAFKETVQLYEQEFGSGEPRYISFTARPSGAVCGNDCGGNGQCSNRFADADFTEAYDLARLQVAA